MSNIAYAFLTINPNNDLITFCKKLYDKYKYDIYIFVDNNNYKLDDEKDEKDEKTNINFIKISGEKCLEKKMCLILEEDNFQMINVDGAKITSSWDKALYYFNYENNSYEHVWFIEDDVFISSIDSFNDIDNNFPTSDLLTSNNIICTDEKKWKWSICLKFYKHPVYSSMVCACRMSKKLLKLIAIQAKELGFIPYLEFSFNTLANQNSLKVDCPKELSCILYRHNWTLEDFKKNKGYLFHPVKDFNNHEEYRNKII